MNETLTGLVAWTGFNLLAALITVLIAWLIVRRGKVSDRSELKRPVLAAFAGVIVGAIATYALDMNDTMQPGIFGVLMGVIAAQFPARKETT